LEQISFELAPQPHYYSVSELTTAMRGLFSEYFTDIWVSGEISGTKLAQSGHYYFTLKDEEAQLRCVCYRMTARYLKFKPQDGVQVLARGRVDLYDARGEVQLIVEVIEPQGHGALQLAFEQLKRKLEMEGLFALERKRPLPTLPERIGIVSSPQGAVIQDILNVLERRCPGRHIQLYPAQVQGEGSEDQVAEGIRYFSESGWAEVVIVARGGGSLEDLWTFNTETVARAIAECSVPVISAVGHETDFTIADFVADLRAPTPSAAAEIVASTRDSLFERIEVAEHRMLQFTRLKLALAAQALHKVAIDQSRLHRTIGKQMQQVDDLDYSLRDAWRLQFASKAEALESLADRARTFDPRVRFVEAHRRLDGAQSVLPPSMVTRLAAWRKRLDAAEAALPQSIRLQLKHARSEFAPLAAHLKQLSPLGILERGYAIVERQGKVVRSIGEAPKRSVITVRLPDGELKATVR
jgi:exodeoxyribonuclease VII large subunit